MKVGKKKVVIQLTEEKIAVLENYAREHGMTVAELLERFIRQLQLSDRRLLHPDLQKISGIIPGGLNIRQMYRDYVLEKYR